MHIYLPVSVPPTQESQGREEKRGVLKGGRALVMDDEEPICEVARDMLSLLGFSVVCVPNGEEMLRAYEEARHAGEPFDVVIMDLTIRGGMGGRRRSASC